MRLQRASGVSNMQSRHRVLTELKSCSAEKRLQGCVRTKRGTQDIPCIFRAGPRDDIQRYQRGHRSKFAYNNHRDFWLRLWRRIRALSSSLLKARGTKHLSCMDSWHMFRSCLKAWCQGREREQVYNHTAVVCHMRSSLPVPSTVSSQQLP